MNFSALTEFEKETGLDFRRKELLREAFVHSSYANEAAAVREPPAHNERLEFLGDAVLEFVVSRYLFERFPDLREGELTRLRAALVRRDTLAKLARSKKMGQFLILGKGEDESGGRTRSATLCATYEAVVGAIYLDKGLDAVQEFVMPDMSEVLETVARRALGKDAKSRLQEWTQAEYGCAPRYRVVDSTGPDHDKQFVIEVSVLGQRCGAGRGRSKQEASQAAANRALVALGQSPVADLAVDEMVEKAWPVAEHVAADIKAESIATQ
jgi:ribonuclease-3